MITRHWLATTLVVLAACSEAPDTATTLQPEAHPTAHAVALHRVRKASPPLMFEENHGQTHASVRFLTHARGMAAFFTEDETVFSLATGIGRSDPRWAEIADVVPRPPEPRRRSSAVRMRFANANDLSPVLALDPLPGTRSYFVGRDRSEWVTGVPTYRRVARRDVYDGIDVVWYGARDALEYDVVVAPGADPSVVRIEFTGHQSMHVDAAGDLVLRTAAGDLRQRCPRVWQTRLDERVSVACSYRIAADGLVEFDLGVYDPAIPLVIDPVFAFSTYLGGSAFEQVSGCAVGNDGSVYVSGLTLSPDFPETTPPPDAEARCFVTKYTPDGSSIAFSLLLGPIDRTTGWSLSSDVDASGAVYVAGWTHSTAFPLAGSPVRTDLGGTLDAFVTKIAPDGNSLVYSTLLGGDGLEDAADIAVLQDGSVIVVGATTSTNFDGVDASSYQSTLPGGPQDAFVTHLSAAGDDILYSTYLGTTGTDRAYSVDVDAAGAAYVVGRTDGAGFPGTATSAIQSTQVGRDGFLVKLTPDGSGVAYGTYLGGSGNDNTLAVAVTSSGEAVAASHARSDPFTGTEDAVIRSDNPALIAAAVTKVNAAGDGLVYSTFIGQRSPAFGVAVDGTGAAHIAGLVITSGSFEFPLVDPVQAVPGAPFEGFATSIDADGTAILFSTYLGGAGGDAAFAAAANTSGRVVIGGETSSSDFPLQNAQQPDLGSPFPIVDAFVATFDFGTTPTITLVTDGEPFHACDTAFDWTAGKQMRFDVVVTGSASPAVATALPAGAVYDTGVDPPAFTWTPTGADVGTHTIAFEAGPTTCTLDVTVVFDTDGDALPDLWETDGYTYEDGTLVTLADLSAYTDRADFVELVAGADPDHRDVFVWVDWMAAPGDASHASHQPDATALDLVLQSFASGPSQGNPDGLPGVRLHLLVAQSPVAHQDLLGDGDVSSFDWTAFDATSTMPPELRWSFHRALFAHDISTASHSGVSREPGIGKASSDFIVSLGSFTAGVGSVSQQAGTFQHELGHNLGLGHGGGDDLLWKPNYLSVMNYLFQMTGLRFEESYGVFDYSFAALPTLLESDLDEVDGLTGPGGVLLDTRWDGYGARWWYPFKPIDAPPPGSSTEESTYLRECEEVNQPIDWNWSDQPPTGQTPAGNVKVSAADADLVILLSDNSRAQVLGGFDDWTNLVFTGGRVGGGISVPLPQVTPLEELTVEQARLIAPAPPGSLRVVAADVQAVLTWKPLGPRKEWNYRVWRAVGDGDPVAIATTQNSEYQDGDAPPGVEVTYSLTAIDALGVESRASQGVTVTLP